MREPGGPPHDEADESSGSRFDTFAYGEDASDDSPRALAPQELIAERYRIVRFIARGGMGEVYEAYDLELNIEVALKTITAKLFDRPKALERFKREVLLSRNVSHANVCRSYDLGTDTKRELSFITMELLRGETLSERLEREGPLDNEHVVKVMTDVAEALGAAHRAGVLHRDLKSSNLYLVEGPPERAVVTDFGLARTLDHVEDADERSTRISSIGTVVGTQAYMSPEQVTGDPLGPTSDIYSLGIVAYEMLSGRLPFEGGSSLSVAAKRLVEDPLPLRERVPDLDPRLEAIVMRCLERDARRRFPDAATLASALRGDADATDVSSELQTEVRAVSAPSAAHASRPAPARSHRFWVAVPAAAAVALVGYLLLRPQSERALPTATPRQLTGVAGWAAEPALSPDGSFIAYTAFDRGNSDIWIIDRSGQSDLRLTSHAAADSAPSWLPDGTAVLFESDRGGERAVWRVPRLGGTPILVLPDAGQPAVSPDGERLAFTRLVPGEGYLRIGISSVDGEDTRILTSSDDGVWHHEQPEWSPDGKLIAYHDERHIWIVDPDQGSPIRFTEAPESDSAPTWSYDGRYIYFTSKREGTQALWRKPVRGGEAVRVTLGTGPDAQPDVSFDGAALAYATTTVDFDVVVRNRETGSEERLQSRHWEAAPSVSPDGRRVAFVSNRRGLSTDLWSVPVGVEGDLGEPERLTALNGSIGVIAYSPDGEWIAFHRVDDEQRDIWIVAATGGAPRPLTTHPSADYQPAWSPRGDAILFGSERGDGEGIWRLDLRDGEPQGEPVLVKDSIVDAREAKWTPDGTEIVYLDVTGDAWRIPVDGDAEPTRVTHGAGAELLTFDQDGGLVVCGRWGGAGFVTRVVDVSDGSILYEIDLAFGGYLHYPEISLSGDGRILAYSYTEARGDIWILESTSGAY